MELFGDKEGDEGGDDRAQDSEKGIVVDADDARHQPCEDHAPQKARTCARANGQNELAGHAAGGYRLSVTVGRAGRS